MTELANAKSESAWETMLRLLHVMCGIPVEVQARILDGHGDWIARADLRIIGTMRLPEYDGATHRERERHHHDLQRDKLLQRAGYERFGYVARDICIQPETIIGDAEDALGWPMQVDRIDGWLAEFDRSLFSRRGLARWAARWC
jgi:very-short-patch-repair endonuclease